MRRRNDLRKRLFGIFEKRLLDLDLDVLHRRLAGALDTWPPLSWIGIWRVKGAVKPVARGATVFLTSHVLEIVEKLCTRVAVINQGRIIAQGKLDDIRSREGENLEDIFMRLIEGDEAGNGDGTGEKVPVLGHAARKGS